MQESQVGQTLWILLNNQKKKINVRVIHALQKGVKIVCISSIRNHKRKRRRPIMSNNRRL